MDNKNPFPQLIEDSLKYLHELKETSSFVLPSSLAPPSAPLPPSKPVQIPLPPAPLPFTMTAPPVKKEPPPPPVEKVEKKAEPAPRLIAPSSPKPIHKDPMEDMRAAMKKAAPMLKITDIIPSDAKAKKIKHAWKDQRHMPDIAILSGPSMPLSFLQQVAKAIDLYFFPCRVIDVGPLETSGSWDALLQTPHLKLIISPDATLWNCKQLMRHYHEIPHKKERFLGKIPLLLLPDPNMYLKDQALKRSLWNLLCHMLQPLQK